MKNRGGSFEACGFTLTDEHSLGLWRCERDGYRISCVLPDDVSEQPEGEPYFAAVEFHGFRFRSVDGATREEAVTLALDIARTSIEKIVSKQRALDVALLDDARQAMQVIALDCATVISPKLDDEERAEAADRVERSVQRLDLALRLMLGLGRDGDVEAWSAARRPVTEPVEPDEGNPTPGPLAQLDDAHSTLLAQNDLGSADELAVQVASWVTRVRRAAAHGEDTRNALPDIDRAGPLCLIIADDGEPCCLDKRHHGACMSHRESASLAGEPFEPDEPAIGDEVHVRADSDRSPRRASVFPPGILAASGCGTEDRCLDCLADPCTCDTDGLDLEDQLDVALGEEPPPAAPLFTVGEDPNDYRYTLAAMRDANAGDAHVLAWLDSAKVGDVLDTMHGARVERVS